MKYVLYSLLAAAAVAYAALPLRADEPTKLGERVSAAPAGILEPTAPIPNTQDPTKPAAQANRQADAQAHFWRDWKIVLSAEASTRFTDNTSQNDRQREDDFIGTFKPTVGLTYATPAMPEGDEFHVDYSPRGVGYLKHPGNDALDQFANLGLRHSWSRTQLQLRHNVDLSSDSTIEQLSLGQHHAETSSLKLGYDATPKTSFYVMPWQKWMNMNTGFQVWNYGSDIGAAWHYTEKWDWVTDYHLGRITSSSGPLGWDNSWVVGAVWKASERNELALRGGAQYVTLSEPKPVDLLRPRVNVQWMHQLTAKLQADLKAEYISELSGFIADELNTRLAFTGGLTYNLTPRIALELRGQGGWIDQTSISTTKPNGGQLAYYTPTLAATYHIGTHTDLRLDYNYTKRTENALYEAYHANSAGISITHHF